MIPCIGFTNDRRICASSTSEKSRRPYVPLSHPFVERLIGTIRRECLDRILFWTAADLEMKLLNFQRYYNGHRTHAGLSGRTPELSTDTGCARANVSSYRWQAHCRGLYQTPMAA
jgi:putative transposase